MSMKTLSAALVLTLVAGAAGAQSLASASGQLAASAGVAPGLYTDAQLVQLVEAKHDHDTALYNLIVSQAGNTTYSTLNEAGPVDTQLAASVGVNPGSLSTVDLIELSQAQHDHDAQAEKFILSGEAAKARTDNTPASEVTAAKVQLAAAAGVDPSKYTLNQLASMQPSP